MLARTACRLAAALMAFASGGAAAAERLPIIDMHLHAHTLQDYGGGGRVCTNDEPIEFPGVDPRKPITIEAVMRCAHPRESAKSDEAVMRESLAALEQKRDIFYNNAARFLRFKP